MTTRCFTEEWDGNSTGFLGVLGDTTDVEFVGGNRTVIAQPLVGLFITFGSNNKPVGYVSIIVYCMALSGTDSLLVYW